MEWGEQAEGLLSSRA